MQRTASALVRSSFAAPLAGLPFWVACAGAFGVCHSGFTPVASAFEASPGDGGGAAGVLVSGLGTAAALLAPGGGPHIACNERTHSSSTLPLPLLCLALTATPYCLCLKIVPCEPSKITCDRTDTYRQPHPRGLPLACAAVWLQSLRRATKQACAA